MEHPVLRRSGPLRLMDYRSCGCPDLSYHGERAWFLPMDGEGSSIGAMYSGAYAKKADGAPDDTLYVACNMYWQPFRFALPDPGSGMKWRIKADSGLEEGFYPDGKEPLADPDGEKSILVPPRTVMILMGR